MRLKCTGGPQPGGAGAQALVAWSLQQTFSDIPFRMVAEEDSADLR